MVAPDGRRLAVGMAMDVKVVSADEALGRVEFARRDHKCLYLKGKINGLWASQPAGMTPRLPLDTMWA